MANYLLIESRDPWESDASGWQELATALVKEGNQVAFFLVQNGVLPARRSSKSAGLSALATAGVEVLADDFSLRERGIDNGRLADGVKPASIDVVVERLAAGHKVIWH